MTCCKLACSSGAALEMYLLWKAICEVFTNRANTPVADSCSANFSTDASGPEIYSNRNLLTTFLYYLRHLHITM